MVNIMNKYRSIKKIIERATGECFGPEFREARMHLEAAAKAVLRAESKSGSREKNNQNQGWFFDVKTASLQNLSAKQVSDAIGKIEDMIESEKRKEASGGSGKIMLD
jgi:hypothetical protein